MEYNKVDNIKGTTKKKHQVQKMNVSNSVTSSKKNHMTPIMIKISLIFFSLPFSICKAELGETIQILFIQYVCFGKSCRDSESYHFIGRWFCNNRL